MYSPHKHSYLQSRSSGIPPRIINRAVAAANSNIPIDEFDLDVPFNRLTSEQPCIPQERVDVTRRPVAFGRLAMPKLRRELHSKDREVVSQAINSIMDLVHDPERCYEAICLRIPDRLADILVDDDPAFRERVCMALTTIAGLWDGKNAITRNEVLMTNLATLFQDDEGAVRIKAAACIEMVSRSWMNADDLVDFNFIPLILDLLLDEDDAIKVIHLETLTHLMYCHGKNQAFKLGAFDIFTKLFDSEDEGVLAGACDCMMMITSIKKGKKMAYKNDTLFRLAKLVHNPNPVVYAAAASAIMFCSVKTRAKIKAAKIKKLPDRLVDLCKDWSNPKAQLYGMKALTNICEHPDVRKHVYKKYNDILEQARLSTKAVNTELMERHKEIMMGIVSLVPSLY